MLPKFIQTNRNPPLPAIANEEASDDFDLEGPGKEKVIIQPNIISIYIRLETLLRLKV